MSATVYRPDYLCSTSNNEPFREVSIIHAILKLKYIHETIQKTVCFQQINTFFYKKVGSALMKNSIFQTLYYLLSQLPSYLYKHIEK